MARLSDALCVRCRARPVESAAVRVCGACSSELRAQDPLVLAAGFQPGDRVVVVDGVFAGHEATVVGSDGSGLVMARAVIMRIPLEVEFLPWQLVKEE